MAAGVDRFSLSSKRRYHRVGAKDVGRSKRGTRRLCTHNRRASALSSKAFVCPARRSAQSPCSYPSRPPCRRHAHALPTRTAAILRTTAKIAHISTDVSLSAHPRITTPCASGSETPVIVTRIPLRNFFNSTCFCSHVGRVSTFPICLPPSLPAFPPLLFCLPSLFLPPPLPSLPLPSCSPPSFPPPYINPSPQG